MPNGVLATLPLPGARSMSRTSGSNPARSRGRGTTRSMYFSQNTTAATTRRPSRSWGLGLGGTETSSSLRSWGSGMCPSRAPCPNGLAHSPVPSPCSGSHPDTLHHRCRGGSWSILEITIRPSVARGWTLGPVSNPASTGRPCLCGWWRSLLHTAVPLSGSPFPCAPASTESCCKCCPDSSTVISLRVPRSFFLFSYGSRTPAATEIWSLLRMRCSEVSGDPLVHGLDLPNLLACTIRSSMSEPGWKFLFSYGNPIHRCIPDFERLVWSVAGC